MGLQNITNMEIIVSLTGISITVCLGLLVYYSHKNSNTSNLSHGLGEVKGKNDALDKKIDEVIDYIRIVSSDIKTVNSTVDTKTESLRLDIRENRKESIEAHGQIGGNIETVRKENREDINRLEGKMADGFKELKEMLRDLQNSSKDDS